MIERIFYISFAIICIFQIQIFPQTKTADLVIFNANVRTLDKKKPKAEAVAVSGNKFLAIGTNKEIRAFIGEKTKTIDANGKLILPGFNDSHVHFLGIGKQFFSIDLRETKTPQEAVEKIKFYVKFLPKNHWILGGFWDNVNWKPNDLPTKELIDAATPENPVFIYNKNPQIALANSLALKIAGFDKKDKAIKNGVIECNESGEPTGIVRGEAVKYLKAFTPNLSEKQESAAAETSTNYAAYFGVTSVQDVHSDDNIEIFRELERQGKLKTRVYDCITLPNWEKLANAGIKRASGDAMIRKGCLKHFSDGDFDVIPDLLKMMIPADKADLQIAVHAIGSRANQVVLNAFEEVEKTNGKRDRRFRIEHAHNMRREDLKRFSASNTIASMQPHLFFGGVFNYSEPYRDLLDSGAKVSFGSDASITDFNPLLGIYAAVMRGNLKDSANQAISVEEAVRAYTIGSAYAEFQENVKGTLTVGKFADMIILSDDIFTIPTEKIPDAKVLTTIVDGKIVYKSK
jgi:predicted amidohydrolase YtcJ